MLKNTIIIKRNKYLKPNIKKKQITVNFFSNPDFMNNLLALCSSCMGDTCPPDCSTTCFLSGTRILTEGGFKNIEKISVEKDVIISYDFKGKKITKSRIVEILIHNAPIFLILNKNIRVTPEHRFWVNNNKWVNAGDIKIGDCLFDSHLKDIAVFSIKSIQKTVIVYNLELSGDCHNYFAEDVLVHNWK